MTAFSHSPGLLNGVGYNNAAMADNDVMTIIGSSFEDLDGKGFLPLNALTSPDGIESYDQIQMSYIDEDGVSQLHTYEYDEFDGWLDCEDGYAPCGDTVGLELGQSAWYLPAGDPKAITTSGAVKKGSKIHTFTETMALASSAFPVAFCPNSENISWGFESYDQIQAGYTDEDGVTQLHTYEYDEYDGWLDCEDGYRILESDEALVAAGKGFWVLLQSEESTFTEVGPLAE